MESREAGKKTNQIVSRIINCHNLEVERHRKNVAKRGICYETTEITKITTHKIADREYWLA